jgi:phosphoribosylamine--glycine ligase
MSNKAGMLTIFLGQTKFSKTDKITASIPYRIRFYTPKEAETGFFKGIGTTEEEAKKAAIDSNLDAQFDVQYERFNLKALKEKLNSNYKFLIISKVGVGMIFAQKLVQEGNQVKMFIEDKKRSDIFDGLVEKVDNWEKEVNWADYVIFDDNDMGTVQDNLRKKGIKVIGGSDYGVKLEAERTFQMEEMKSVGLNVAPYKEFKNFKDAIQFVKDYPGMYVVKPNGLKMQDFKEFTYVGNDKSGNDVIGQLSVMENEWKGSVSFILQKKIVGSGLAIGCYFNGKEFVEPVEINYEYKKANNGNLGIATGETGTAIYFCEFTKLFYKTLNKFESKLKESGYIGDFDINFILEENTDELYALEATPRFGWPSTLIHIMSMETSCTEFLINLINGKNGFKTKGKYAIGVLVCAPPFPYENEELFKHYNEGNILNLNGAKDISLSEVKLVNGKLLATGNMGYLCTAVGYSDISFEDARKKVYVEIEKIKYPNILYRTDIGIGDMDKLDILKKLSLID